MKCQSRLMPTRGNGKYRRRAYGADATEDLELCEGRLQLIHVDGGYDGDWFAFQCERCNDGNIGAEAVEDFILRTVNEALSK